MGDKIDRESKVLDIQEPTSNGEWYNFAIEFENGDKGIYGVKGANTQDYFKVNAVAKYKFEDGQYPKIWDSKTKAWTGGKGGGYKQEPFEHKAAGFAASYAKDLMVAKLITKDELKSYFEAFYKLMISKKLKS